MMKTRMLSMTILFIAGSVTLFGQQKTEKFKVYGNCGSCEKRIETAAKSVSGVSAADWNQETEMMEVTFDTTKTSISDIEKTIAKVGHDTQMYRAEDADYAKLPGCCHYDRAQLSPENTGEKAKQK